MEPGSWSEIVVKGNCEIATLFVKFLVRIRSGRFPDTGRMEKAMLWRPMVSDCGVAAVSPSENDFRPHFPHYGRGSTIVPRHVENDVTGGCRLAPTSRGGPRFSSPAAPRRLAADVAVKNRQFRNFL